MLFCYSFSNFVPDHPALASESQEQCLMTPGNCQCIIMPAFSNVLPFAWHTNTQALTCQHATGFWSTKTFCKLVCQHYPGCCHANRPTEKLVCQHSDKCCWHVPFLVCCGMPYFIPNHRPNACQQPSVGNTCWYTKQQILLEYQNPPYISSLARLMS